MGDTGGAGSGPGGGAGTGPGRTEPVPPPPPMTTERRMQIYAAPMTLRQWRQVDRMGNREVYRLRGWGLPRHGATGERIRRPKVYVSKPPERGSIVTHVAAYCAPCDVHGRPRLHRYGRGAA